MQTCQHAAANNPVFHQYLLRKSRVPGDNREKPGTAGTLHFQLIRDRSAGGVNPDNDESGEDSEHTLKYVHDMHVRAGCCAACRCAVRQQAATLYLLSASFHVLVPVLTSDPARTEPCIAICSSYASLHGDLECDGHLEEQYEKGKESTRRMIMRSTESNALYKIVISLPTNNPISP